MNNKPLISVIIINYKTPQLTIDCIKSIYECEIDQNYEIILLDNHSEDDSIIRFKKEIPKVTLIEADKNYGFAAGNNLAVKEASGKYLLFLNSDTVLTKKILDALINQLQDSSIGIVAPRILNPDRSLQKSVYKFPTLWRSFCESFFLSVIFPESRVVGDYRKFKYNKDRLVDFTSGACFMMGKDLFISVNGFDERFFMYAEETDLAFRLNRKGYMSKFLAMGDVIHLGGASGPGVHVFKDQFCKSKVLYYRKHYGVLGLRLFLLMKIIGFILRNIAFRVKGNKEKIVFNQKVIKYYAKSFSQ